jgi:GR25 family glycosyltransferase involved in LPS biosynthesis
MNKISNHIYCIITEEEEEKYLFQSKQFSNINLNVNFYRPKRDADNSLRGCFQSHINLIKKAYSENFDNIIIFESDVLFLNFDIDDFNYIINEISFFINNEEYDILKFGPIVYMYLQSSITSPIIWEAYTDNAHAYILSKNAINKIHHMFIDTNSSHSPDYFLSNHLTKKYALLYPYMFIIQNRILGKSVIKNERDVKNNFLNNKFALQKFMILENDVTKKAYEFRNNQKKKFLFYKQFENFGSHSPINA